MSRELPPELRAKVARRIECPVAWCSGIWLEHGGDGSAPGHWVHDDADGIPLPHGAHLYRSQVGGGAIEWTLVVQGDGQSVSLPSKSTAVYADELMWGAPGVLRVT
jgi:hypothetical protein